MTLIDIVAMTAVLQYLVFGGLVSRARTRHGIKAPAITGHPQFERVHRVHVNTLELLVAFLPALYAAGRYWPSSVIAGIGGVYVLGRVVYWQAYVRNPSGRRLGFILSAAPVLGLVLAALVGAVLGRGGA